MLQHILVYGQRKSLQNGIHLPYRQAVFIKNTSGQMSWAVCYQHRPFFELVCDVTDCRNWTVSLPFTITQKAKETHAEEEGSINADFYKDVALSEPH